MDTDKLFELATPYLGKKRFRSRAYQAGFRNCKTKLSSQTRTRRTNLHPGCYLRSFFILFFYGASADVMENYGSILKKLGCSGSFIRQVCEIISTHHEHPDNPSEPFKTLYDSDKIVMFSPQEYPYYNAQEGFDWNKIVNLIYSAEGKELAKKSLAQRRKSKTTQYK